MILQFHILHVTYTHSVTLSLWECLESVSNLLHSTICIVFCFFKQTCFLFGFFLLESATTLLNQNNRHRAISALFTCLNTMRFIFVEHLGHNL